MDIISFTAGAGEGIPSEPRDVDNFMYATDADLGLRISAGVVQSAGGTNFGDMISASDIDHYHWTCWRLRPQWRCLRLCPGWFH